MLIVQKYNLLNNPAPNNCLLNYFGFHISNNVNIYIKNYICTSKIYLHLIILYLAHIYNLF